MASPTVGLLTCMSWAICSTDGSRSPTRYAPERTAKVIWSTTRACMRGSCIGRKIQASDRAAGFGAGSVT